MSQFNSEHVKHFFNKISKVTKYIMKSKISEGSNPTNYKNII